MYFHLVDKERGFNSLSVGLAMSFQTPSYIVKLSASL